MSTVNKKTGIILMTYGSATVAENVSSYFLEIYRGRASKELIADFSMRYRLVGHSPLIEITKEQARLLGKILGSEYVVEAGMRHSAPTIEEAVAGCEEAGATHLRGIILSPQFSTVIMEGYKTSFAEAAVKAGFLPSAVSIAKPWPDQKQFIAFLTGAIVEKLRELKKMYRVSVPVVFTTHSLPQSVVQKDPHYLDQLKVTIDAVVKNLPKDTRWYACYQSAGHTPEEWLKPDLTDILDLLQQENHKAVLIAPIQFLADHLEILYDLDVAGKEQCAERRIFYHRTELPNTHPVFIEALASIAKLDK